VAKVDNLVDQIVRIQFGRIKQAPPRTLIEKQQNRAVELARAKLKQLNEQYGQKQRDYQALREETLKVVQGISRLNADMLNSLTDETSAQLKELEQLIVSTGAELQAIEADAKRVRQEYTQLMDWAALYDNCTFDAKKMIIAQFVKTVYVKRGFEIDIKFNVSLEEFQALCLDAEAESDKSQKGLDVLTYTGNAGQTP